MEEIDRNRLKEVRIRCVRAARYWLDLHVAAGNSDVEGCKGIYKHIRDATVETSDLLKALGVEKEAAK